MRIQRALVLVVFCSGLLLSIMQPSLAMSNAAQWAPDCNTISAFKQPIPLLPPNLLPPDSTWMPTFARTEIGQLTPSTRYILNLFSFTNTWGFGIGSTYEHDVSLNTQSASRDGAGSYLAKDENNDLPVYVRAASNLPGWYVDTREFDDRSIQLSFAIGALDGDSLQPNVLYYTFYEVENGDADKDTAVLDVQLGCQIPPSCFGIAPAICSFGAAYRHIFPDWGIPVPGFCQFGDMPEDDAAIRASLGLQPLIPVYPKTCYSGQPVSEAGDPNAEIATVPPPPSEQGAIQSEYVEPTSESRPPEQSSDGQVIAPDGEAPVDQPAAQGPEVTVQTETPDMPDEQVDEPESAPLAPITSYIDIGGGGDQYVVSGLDPAGENVEYLGQGWQCTLGGFDDWSQRQQLVEEDTIIRIPVTPGMDANLTLCVGNGEAPDDWTLTADTGSCTLDLGNAPQTPIHGGPEIYPLPTIPSSCLDSGLIELRFTNKSNFGAGLWGILVEQAP